MQKKPLPINVSTSAPLYRARTYAVCERTLEFASGEKQTYSLVKHPGAVVVAPLTADRKVLLLRQYRQAFMREIWELPAGTLGEGEDPLDCAKRELTEETNHSAARWHSLGQLYPAPGFCDEVQHLYLAQDLEPAVGTPDDDEIITVHSFTLTEFEELIRTGELSDAKSIALLLRAKLMGLL